MDHINIDVQKYTLKKYTPAKVTEQTLDAVYVVPDEQNLKSITDAKRKLHAQQKCENLSFPFERTHIMKVPIKNALLLVDMEHESKRVWELTLDTATIPLNYQPGDTVGILPSNAIKDIKQLIHAMQLEDVADQHCQLKVLPICTKKTAKVPSHIPQLSTTREILSDCLNLNTVLKKQFLSALAEHCTRIEDRDFLACLSSKEGAHFYNELILERRLTLLKLLQMCPSCKPTLPLLVEHLPRLLPRPYSIANSPLAHANEIKIIFSVLKENPGVTTDLLDSIANSAIVEIHPQMKNTGILMYLRESNRFHYTTEEAMSNQILISIGTGLAPFLGFLEHKEQILKEPEFSEATLGDTWLFIGASTEHSILHREALLQWRTAGILNKYFESFSRVSDAQHHYIQEQLETNSQAFVDFLMQPQTILYICADGAQISKSLQAAISRCLQQELNLSEVETLAILKEFRANGKYREDLWI